MTDKELKHLRRAELLEMLIAQMEESEKLRESLEEAKKALSDRQITINQAGSIADAAMQLNDVFDAAQNAATQYLENIQRLSTEQEAVCRQMEADARKEAEAIRAAADEYSWNICVKADTYWERVSEKARMLLRDQESLSAVILQGGKEDSA